MSDHEQPSPPPERSRNSTPSGDSSDPEFQGPGGPAPGPDGPGPDGPGPDGLGGPGPGGPGPGGPGPGGPDDGDPDSDLDPKEMRRHCFRLIREVTSQLGWKYKLWIPAAVILSSVNLLPQRFLQYFAEGSSRLSEIGADDFVKMLIIFGIGVGICQWVANMLDGILSEWLRLTVSIGLKKDAVVGLNRTRIDALDSANRGDWMTRMTSDLYNAEEFMTRSLPDQVTNVTMLIGSAALFFYYSGPVAFIPLVAALVLGWINISVQKKMGPIMGHARMLEGGVFQSMIETFEGLRTIRSFGGEKFTSTRIDKQLKKIFTAGMRITRSMALVMGSNELISQLVITAILTLIAYQIKGETMTARDALVYPFFINLFLGAAKSLVISAYDWNRFFVEGGRLASLLYDEENKETDPKEVFGDLDEQAADVTALHGIGITIAYGDNAPVVKDRSLELNRGELIAVMGPSGCGKSTLVESVAGLRRANAGEFRILMNDGSAKTFPQSPTFISAFVEQQPYLFVGSIRDNIAMGRDGVTDELIDGALAEVGLSKLVQSRGGIDHVLGDRGRNLSVGQQYRLALCRALVFRRPFLLMDEPFAALDFESVDRVIETMKQEKARGTGILLITHLLPESLEADKVITLTPER